ncbi:MAG: PilT/PilU family type 4a pilus ATPase [Gammaproteobacteria bacterium]|nr:PilT/PilU family type 4a pilus ATPase [Gammaproteobacteria bacterium]
MLNQDINGVSSSDHKKGAESFQFFDKESTDQQIASQIVNEVVNEEQTVSLETPLETAPAAVPQVAPVARMGDPIAFLNTVVQESVDRRASDIHLRSGQSPLARIDSVLVVLSHLPVLSEQDTENFARAILTSQQWDTLQDGLQVDSSVATDTGGRLRVNTYFQLGTIAMAMRVVQTKVPHMRDMGLPEAIDRAAHLERGLVILTGATGSGKSTTIASLIDEINRTYAKHIITIEDPVEFMFEDKKSIVSQREIGIDAPDFAKAMKAALREDPDVILLGEMRDKETMEAALTAAETGHLVFTTLHAPGSPETITRLTAEFSGESQVTIRAKLSANLRAVIAQRLLPRKSGEGRVAAVEVMHVNARIRELILDPLRAKEIGDLLKKASLVEGMLSFDEHLFQLVKSDQIDEAEALKHASSATDLKLKIDGFG